MIEGVHLKSLKVIAHEKGDIRHVIRCDDPVLKSFGEVYVSFLNAGCIKGWKKHLRQTQCMASPLGNIKFVLYDDRAGSKTLGEVQEIVIGEDQYQLLTIPSGVWYSFGSQTDKLSQIINCTDLPHDPNESVSKDLSDQSIPFTWK